MGRVLESASLVVILIQVAAVKGRYSLLAKRGGDLSDGGGRTPEMLSDDAKTKAGNRNISPALGVMLVGKPGPSGRGKNEAVKVKTYSLHSPSD